MAPEPATLESSTPNSRLGIDDAPCVECGLTPVQISSPGQDVSPRPIIFTFALLIAACGPGESERIVLADLDLPGQTVDPIFGQIVARPMGLHRFGDGWYPPGGDAILSWSQEATVEFSLLGRDHRFRMIYSSHPKLVERGIRGNVEFNGVRVANLEPRPGWALDTLTVILPPGVVERGMNRVRINTTDRLREGDGEDLKWSLYVKKIQIEGRLNSDEARTWERWTSVPSGGAAKAIRIPGEVESDRPQAESEAPDVVMIVLDALRADRVGAWGYERDTTPNLDRLAREGVPLTSVHAEAPYTRSSVATLFSSYSWRDHKVLSGKQALGRHFTTLAELLQDSGWFTLAISDNSNVARSAGSDQGFDEFVQTWSDVDLEREESEGWWWPEKPVLVWEERLSRGLDTSRPTFAYLHLMPPHEPYFPGPEHDRFGPDGYEGPVTGNTPDILAFNKGELASGTPDQERLEALYDGGLHRGDALVERALQAWRMLGRDRPLLLVFVSDHGEAFGEHDRYGHNSSVHAEMTHVPVILHPAAMVPESIRETPDALRSLGDLYPILVHTLGLSLPSGTTWPARVLEVIEDPARPRDEIMIRCGTPRFGRRTANGLWEFEVGRAQRYFDTASDPGARHDLRGTDDESWLEGFSAIRAFLASPISAQGADPADLSEEDRERLRALGYTGGR